MTPLLCPHCGDALPLVVDAFCPSCRESLDPGSARAGWPLLWNPNAAAGWCLLLTPAFGAYLHAANWRALGKNDRATANMVWVWVSVVLLAINAGSLLLPDFKAIDGAMRFAGLGVLLGWYFSQGRPLAKFVTETLEDKYIKKGWGLPLLIGAASVGAYFAVCSYLAVAAYSPEPSELAAEVKPMILQAWQEKPELRGASIQNVTLLHKAGKVYTGFVDATLGGSAERLSLEVVYDRGTIVWELKPLATK